jgi:hypothetical protein
MDQHEFWALIDASRQVSTDCEEQADALTALLAQREPGEIIGFEQQFWERRYEAFRWDLLAVAYIVNGWCSNDGFDYFRGWLIAQGREYFEAALASPERAADRVVAPLAEDEVVDCEDILYVAYLAYEERTGQEFPPSEQPRPDIVIGEPQGERWDEGDLPRLYPELWRRFGQRRRC